MHTLSVDIETYSGSDLKDVGVYRYAEDPDFEVMLIAYKIDDRETRIIDCTNNEDDAEFRTHLYDPNTLKTAFNANFERTCLARHYEAPMPPYQWQCTMVRSAMLGLPMSLEAVGNALHLPEDKAKLKTGKALIQYFCKPCKPTRSNGGRTRNLPAHDQDKWDLFKEYCIRDVDTEHEILSILSSFGPMPESECRLWELDQLINDTGILTDQSLIRNIMSYDISRKAELMEEAQSLTGLSNPNSPAQLKKWLTEVKGVAVEGLTKADVAALLSEELPADVRRVLEIRQALGKTSTAKYTKMADAACDDDRIRGCLRFYGSKTGRWAGRLVQVQNLPQNHIDDIFRCRELVAEGDIDSAVMCWGESAFIFSQLIRTAFIPAQGHIFVVSDFSAIEARVLAWLADEKWRMEVFASGGDIYCASASKMFGVPVEKHGINGHLRQKGKVAELALGYQGGVGAIKSMDSSGSIPEEEMPGIVADWREASPNVVKLWKQIELAAKTAVREGRPEKRPAKVLKGRIQFYMQDSVLFMVLPSGRRIAYFDAEVVRQTDGRDHLMFKAVNQTSRKWGDSETYGGKLTENAVQAIARDCLAEAMLRVDAAGYKIVMHVHDEMIIEFEGNEAEAEKALEEVNSLMAVPPEWAPDLVLRGDGYVTPFYRKD